MNMKLRAIALIAFLFVLTLAANAQATRADLPAPDNFLGIATFPLWAEGVKGELSVRCLDFYHKDVETSHRKLTVNLLRSLSNVPHEPLARSLRRSGPCGTFDATSLSICLCGFLLFYY
jgi:hypothetical protein